MRMDPRGTKGFTLIEMMVAIAILAILVSLAAPSFNSFIDKYRVKRAADSISAFLINTKSEAIKRNTTVRAVFKTGGWCVGMTTDATCDCTVANSCQLKLNGVPDGAERVVRGSDYRGILLAATESAFAFTPLQGRADVAGNAEVTSANGLKVRVVVKNTTGRIRLCSPSGAGNVGGYPVC